MKAATVVSLLALIGATVVRAEGGDQPCPHVPEAGECYTVHARLFVANGAPAIRLWKVGTQRILGVSAEEEGLPECVRRHLGFDKRVYGDFVLCPLKPDRPGRMRSVCVQSVSRMVVEAFTDGATVTIPAQRSCGGGE